MKCTENQNTACFDYRNSNHSLCYELEIQAKQHILCKMPKAKKRKVPQKRGGLTHKERQLTHNECLMRSCIWCGKKRNPGSLQNISQKNLLLIQKHGSASLEPSTDPHLPKVICTSCRLGLKDLETPPDSGKTHHLPPLFDHG